MFTFDFNDTYAGLEMDKITKRNDCFKSNKKKLRKILVFTIKTCRLAQTNIISAILFQNLAILLLNNIDFA
jgi:hypothetical protein